MLVLLPLPMVPAGVRRNLRPERPDRIRSGAGNHIFTASKPTWISLPPGEPTVTKYYHRAQYWPKESLERREAFRDRIEPHHYRIRSART